MDGLMAGTFPVLAGFVLAMAADRVVERLRGTALHGLCGGLLLACGVAVLGFGPPFEASAIAAMSFVFTVGLGGLVARKVVVDAIRSRTAAPTLDTTVTTSR